MQHKPTTEKRRRLNGVRCPLCCAALLLCFLLLPAQIVAEISIPAGTVSIDDQAFAQCQTATRVVVPEGVVSIGREAFRGCAGLQEITLPASLKAFGEDMLADCSDSLWIHCAPESLALEWARANAFDYDANTQYRALIIGQSYAGTSLSLTGPVNDAQSLRSTLASMQKARWSIKQEINLTGSDILAAAKSAFSQATANDVSLFYYSGHGAQDGSLIGSDRVYVSPSALRSALDTIPGRKVVIVDACYSGQLIDESAVTTFSAARDFSSQFIAAFTAQNRGALNADGYFVISSAGPHEMAQEGSLSSSTASKVMGFFTYCLCRGLGWNGVTNLPGALLADANADHAVSIAEAAAYASAQARLLNPNQTAQYWPTDAAWFAPFRP